MTLPVKSVSRLLAAFLALSLFAALDQRPSFAQSRTKQAKDGPMPNAFQGFSRNRKDPVKIEANSLEVRDKEQVAVFSGNVVVVQGDTTMRCRELVVHYEGNAIGDVKKPAPKAKPKQDASAQRIKRLVANGGVIVTATDQRATGDRGVFEMASNTVTLSGNVIVTQGQNVLRGDKLTVDLTSGKSRLDGTRRVEGLFLPNDIKNKTKDKKSK